MEQRDDTHFFIHVPKTAGTSYRKAFEEKFGSQSIVYDYGKQSSDTSEVTRNVYKKGLFSELDRLRSFRMIAGHMPVQKYAPAVGVKNCFAFIRDPIQRCYSDFIHLKKHYGFKGGLAEYLSVPENRNRQAFFLSGVPDYSISFIGLTEEYSLSLQLLSATNPGLSVKEMSLNVNRKRPVGGYELTDSEVRLLKNANSKDISLYERVKKQFEQQYLLHAGGNPVFRGVIQQVNRHSIVGWVAGNEIASVEAVIGDEVVGEAMAVDFRPSLAGWGIEREGFVGFAIRNPEAEMSLADVRVKGTNFYLPKF